MAQTSFCILKVVVGQIGWLVAYKGEISEKVLP